MTETPDVRSQMMQMITGYWTTQIVRGAAHLSLAEHLDHGTITAAEIAEAEGISHDACARLLQACAGLGLVRAEGERFAATELLQTLRAGPNSLRGWALCQAAPGHWLPWGRFLDALRSGERQTLGTLGAEIFEYYKTVPDEAAAFTEAMTGMTGIVSAEVARLLETTPYTKAVDVGGAAGAFVQTLLLHNPKLEGIVFDLPNVVESANPAEIPELANRIQFAGGDFLQQVPAGDLYLLKWILHNWSDDDCLTILRNCRRAALPGARLVVVEQLLEPEASSPFTPLMDLNMLVMLTGRERTLPEYQKLFSEAGFGSIEVTRTNSPMMLLTADAV